MTDDEKMMRARRAEAMLADPLFQEVIATIEAEALQAWRATKTADTQQRDFSWLTIKALDRVKLGFQMMVDNGYIAASRVVRRPD